MFRPRRCNSLTRHCSRPHPYVRPRPGLHARSSCTYDGGGFSTALRLREERWKKTRFFFLIVSLVNVSHLFSIRPYSTIFMWHFIGAPLATDFGAMAATPGIWPSACTWWPPAGGGLSRRPADGPSSAAGASRSGRRRWRQASPDSATRHAFRSGGRQWRRAKLMAGEGRILAFHF